MVDFTRSIATAQRLITANGRSVTFVEFDSTPSVPANPWDPPTDQRGSPDATLTLDAAFVPISGLASLGLRSEIVDLAANSEQVLMCSPGATQSLEQFNEIIDGSTRWKIDFTDTLRPGAEIVLVFVGVSR